ncbi:flagellar biosynthesis protein FlgA [Enterovibrio norvegicus]|uniref:(2R)-sulfolactate sulfo-lyase subunit alpha n=3 Tax=Enterovibrio TaxID=188143 RepID=A0A1I5K829_9GAMM|nr:MULTISPECIES: UxaA family hydrolase [Enterovibrio]MCC4798081.1 UxaA family hydrolase [Enterovibrio norvegicus]MDD1793289.1 UxaA family hydrolase [Enterovibrio sp. ZSDZ42]OEE63714.1 flagellar biosynthesis protein FlgA [Enterovibrio norvegicus]OEF51742.1 flagellar biosynthesis protein FlgA [Enterovibrio norvegicus]OEF55856.1 flagellar biosynthesis protein FlgA [Enterovibrio norvegicus]
MQKPDFLVHDSTDSVGVIVVEGLEAGQTLVGWVMDTDATIEVLALDAIPLGHKVALNDIKDGDTILKYDNDIGKAIADIAKGGHVHVQNVKTKRW